MAHQEWTLNVAKPVNVVWPDRTEHPVVLAWPDQKDRRENRAKLCRYVQQLHMYVRVVV